MGEYAELVRGPYGDMSESLVTFWSSPGRMPTVDGIPTHRGDGHSADLAMFEIRTDGAACPMKWCPADLEVYRAHSQGLPPVW